MPRNHPHWNTDDWEDPNNGLQVDDALLERRDVELSKVAEVNPSGVTPEEIEDFKNQQNPGVDAGGSIIGDIDKELEMSDGKSNRVQRVEYAVSEHSDSISQLTEDSRKAQETANGALADAKQANDELGGLIDQDTDNPLGLWRLQETINRADAAALQAHQLAIEANTLAINSLSRTVTRHLPLASSGENEYVSVWGNTLTIKGNWVGHLVVLEEVPDTIRASSTKMPVPLPTGKKTYTANNGHFVLITVQGGTAVNAKVTKPGKTTLLKGQWTTALSWTAPEKTTVLGSASFKWLAKTFQGTYEARITVDGVPAISWETSSSAPIFGHGQRDHRLTFQSIGIEADSILRLEYRADHDNPINREVSDEEMNLAYVKPEKMTITS